MWTEEKKKKSLWNEEREIGCFSLNNAQVAAQVYM